MGVKFYVKVAPNAESDQYRKGHLQPYAAEIGKLLDVAPVAFLQNLIIRPMRLMAESASRIAPPQAEGGRTTIGPGPSQRKM